MLTRVLPTRLRVALPLATLLVVLSGCGDGRKTVYKVRGQVFTAKKQPAAGAMVTFQPVKADPNDPARPIGKVDEQGNYVLTTYMEGDGAPAGEYVITITWPVAKKTPFDSDGPDRIGRKLARPESSPHKFTVEAKPDQEVPPITLP